MISRFALRICIWVALVTGSGSALAQSTHILEFRRTMHSAECDTGELYIDGKIAALFSAAPGLIDARVKTNPFVGDKVITATFPPFTGLYGSKPYRGFELRSDNGGTTRLIALDGGSYTDYVRPRARKYAIPSDVILIGTLLLARECKVSSGEEDANYTYTYPWMLATTRLTYALFGAALPLEPYQVGKEVQVIAIVSEASDATAVDAGALKLLRAGPLNSGANEGQGSSCLFEIEHMGNTRIFQTGTTYKRIDDVWFCPNYSMQGGLGSGAIEVRRRPDYIEYQSLAECGTFLGLPVMRTYLVGRNENGSGGKVWTRCFNGDFVTFSEASTIRYGKE